MTKPMPARPMPAAARILLIGVGPTAASALESLAPAFDVVGVVRDAQPGSDDPVVALAAEQGIRLFTDPVPSAVEALVSELRPDCVVVSSYNRILKPALLARCPFVNVHYAPLPQYRGRANVNWALINGEPCAAISIHVLTPDLDAGNILFQQTIPIGPADTVADLYRELNGLQREHLAESVGRLLAGDLGSPQDHAQATYGCARVPDDGEIDWSDSTSAIDRLVRALAPPFPGAYTFFAGRQLLVWQVRPVENPPRYAGRVPGRVVGRAVVEGSVDVLTGDGVLRLLEVQLAGQELAPAAAVIRSTRDTLGLRTIDLLRRIEALEQQAARLLEVQMP